MAESAMSGISWDGGWTALSNWDNELLFFKDKLDNKDIDDPALKLTKHEIAEQVLQSIEDLGKYNTEDWLDELPLFDDLQILTPAEKLDKIDQQHPSPKDGTVLTEIQEKSPAKDLLSASYEDAATFILSNDNIIYISNEPFLSLDPGQQGCTETVEYDEEKSPETTSNPSPDSSWTDPDVKTEMAVVEEIIRNTALELDQWESDTTQSEISSDGTSATDSSSKEKEEEIDDPEWKPVPPNSAGRKHLKRPKPYLRGGSQEEKKLRKKEQNKNAATRYRQKKKAETHEILREEEELKAKKAKLEETVADIEHEIRCVKAFMRDFFKAKGMI